MILETIKQKFETQKMQGEMQRDHVMNMQQVRHAEDSHQMAMRQTAESGDVKLQQMKQQQSVKKTNDRKQR
jgi:hypothetical protein